MNTKKGFTLLELLIAATILGLLAVVATVSFRNGAVDARIAAARIKADQLAAAVQRFRINNTDPISGRMADLPGSGPYACSLGGGQAHSAVALIACGYVDNGGWSDEYVNYYVCDSNISACATSPIANPLVCMAGRDNNKRLRPEQKESSCYRYCVSRTESKERMGNADGSSCSGGGGGGGTQN